MPEAFDAPVADAPDALRHFGFLVPRHYSNGVTATFPDGVDPTVLVGLSTTYQRQEELLRAIVEALADMAVRALVTTAGQVDIGTLPRPSNVTIAEYVPHTALMEATDVMVTHAGMGSVAHALSVGVPLVCTPMDRDQPLNAQRVESFGAGIALTADSTAAEIAAAVERVLAPRAIARAASRAGRNES